ncbi:hypothetical protein PAPYR_1352 [Paratrimastix pyriformis]|uniref:VWFA domain-containing protein n=1 Tax=Paratrimastix pyriformis TaxID=342808 RepID=A0ABQ8UXQ8_9EUKA|nr:hypothetical protein PAPYR_1352 [Paratrimastix pyriformis]
MSSVEEGTPRTLQHVLKTAFVGPRSAGKSEFVRAICDVFPTVRSEDELMELKSFILKKTLAFLHTRPEINLSLNELAVVTQFYRFEASLEDTHPELHSTPELAEGLDRAAAYLTANYHRILTSDYMPTDQDILALGAHRHLDPHAPRCVRVCCGGKFFDLLDNIFLDEHGEWPRVLDEVDAVVFFAPLDAPDPDQLIPQMGSNIFKQMADGNATAETAEHAPKNHTLALRLADALSMYEALTQGTRCKHMALGLVFTKLDVLARVLPTQDMRGCFPEFSSGASAEATLKYIKRCFDSLLPEVPVMAEMNSELTPNAVQKHFQAMVSSIQDQLSETMQAEHAGQKPEFEDFREAIMKGAFPLRQELSYDSVLNGYEFDFAPAITGPDAHAVPALRRVAGQSLAAGGAPTETPAVSVSPPLDVVPSRSPTPVEGSTDEHGQAPPVSSAFLVPSARSLASPLRIRSVPDFHATRMADQAHRHPSPSRRGSAASTSAPAPAPTTTTTTGATTPATPAPVASPAPAPDMTTHTYAVWNPRGTLVHRSVTQIKGDLATNSATIQAFDRDGEHLRQALTAYTGIVTLPPRPAPTAYPKLQNIFGSMQPVSGVAATTAASPATATTSAAPAPSVSVTVPATSVPVPAPTTPAPSPSQSPASVPAAAGLASIVRTSSRGPMAPPAGEIPLSPPFILSQSVKGAVQSAAQPPKAPTAQPSTTPLVSAAPSMASVQAPDQGLMRYPALFVPKFTCGLCPEPFTRHLRRYMAVGVQSRFRFEAERTDTNLVLVVDTSATMEGCFNETFSEWTQRAQHLNTEKSKLGLLKKQLLTAVTHLHPGDHVAMLTFAGEVTTVFPLAPMTPPNVARLRLAVEKLQPQGVKSNIMPVLLQKARQLLVESDLAQTHVGAERQNRVLLITDRMPLSAVEVAPPLVRAISTLAHARHMPTYTTMLNLGPSIPRISNKIGRIEGCNALAVQNEHHLAHCFAHLPQLLCPVAFHLEVFVNISGPLAIHRIFGNEESSEVTGRALFLPTYFNMPPYVPPSASAATPTGAVSTVDAPPPLAIPGTGSHEALPPAKPIAVTVTPPAPVPSKQTPPKAAAKQPTTGLPANKHDGGKRSPPPHGTATAEGGPLCDEEDYDLGNMQDLLQLALVQLVRVDGLSPEEAAVAPGMHLTVRYKRWVDSFTEEHTFYSGLPLAFVNPSAHHLPAYTPALRKAVVLCQYMSLMTLWLRDPRAQSPIPELLFEHGLQHPIRNLSKWGTWTWPWEEEENALFVSEPYQRLFRAFLAHFQREMWIMDDSSLKREEAVLLHLINDVPAAPKLH